MSSNICKILEEIVRDTVIEYSKKLFNLNQFYNRANHNTTHAIIGLTETTHVCLIKSLKVGGVYLGIAKALDTLRPDN